MYSSPLRHFTRQIAPPFSCDLHVLATPPAFVLSQDQTLHLNYLPSRRVGIWLTEDLKLVPGPVLGWPRPSFGTRWFQRAKYSKSFLGFVTRILSSLQPRKKP